MSDVVNSQPPRSDWKAHVSAIAPLAIVAITAAIGWGASNADLRSAQSDVKALRKDVAALTDRATAYEKTEAVTQNELLYIHKSLDDANVKLDRLSDRRR